jgi:hypothetical protein
MEIPNTTRIKGKKLNCRLLIIGVPGVNSV